VREDAEVTLSAPETEATKRVVTKPKPIVPCIPDPALLFKKGPPPILRSNRLTLEGNPPDENTLVESPSRSDTFLDGKQAPEGEASNRQACQTSYEGCLQVDSGSQPERRSVSLYEEVIAGIIIFIAKVDGFCGHPLQKLRAFLWPGERK
jgi:hypothetical protein